MKIKVAAFNLALLCASTNIWGAITVSDPTDDWTPLPYAGPSVLSDYPEDTQASSPDLDLVGDSNHSAVYTLFDSANSLLAFRFRLGGDKNPPGFGGQVWIGADVNQDANIDIFIGANDTNITFNNPSDGENISPSTTTIDTKAPLYSIAVSSGINYLWEPVTLGINGNDPDGISSDIDGDANPKNKSGNDYFLTILVDFSEFALAVNNLPNMSGFSESSTLAYVVGTASQGQTINSDLNGISGGTNDSITWESSGAITPELGVNGSPVPEPATTALAMGLLALVGVLLRRRG